MLRKAFTWLFGLKGPPRPVDPEVYTQLHLQHLNSFTLLPVVRENALGKTTPTEDFNLIIKVGEFKNDLAVNPRGEPTAMHCSTFLTIPAHRNDAGELVVDYVRRERRGDMVDTMTHSFAIVPDGIRLDLPLIRNFDGKDAELRHRSYSLTTYPPRSLS